MVWFRFVFANSMQSPLNNFDPLRDGLRNLKEQCRSGHEVEQMQKELQSEGFSKSLKNMQQIYGLALPARMQIEAQIVNKTRLGLPSSRLALDTLLGRLDEISPETYLGLPEHSTEMVDYREVIEQQRGIQLMPKRF